jgi:hypothetical protein
LNAAKMQNIPSFASSDEKYRMEMETLKDNDLLL